MQQSAEFGDLKRRRLELANFEFRRQPKRGARTFTANGSARHAKNMLLVMCSTHCVCVYHLNGSRTWMPFSEHKVCAVVQATVGCSVRCVPGLPFS